jgi:anti-sigma B factor antagonist
MIKHHHLRVERRDGLMLVTFLDSKIHAELAITTLGDELQAIAARPDCVKLVLNFAEVEFLTSAMLGKLISANRVMHEKGGTMVLCEICENLRTIFRLTRLETIFDIRPTEADALAVAVGATK